MMTVDGPGGYKSLGDCRRPESFSPPAGPITADDPQRLRGLVWVRRRAGAALLVARSPPRRRRLAARRASDRGRGRTARRAVVPPLPLRRIATAVEPRLVAAVVSPAPALRSGV